MSNFEDRKAARIERYKNLAAKSNEEAEARHAINRRQIESMAGTPILIGHHSEKRHRRALERIDQNFSKAHDLFEKSKYYDQRVKAAENNKAIYTDDPEALQKLKAKLTELEERRERIKAINKITRNISNSEELLAVPDLSNEEKAELQSINSIWGGFRFPAYVLQNLGASIRTVKSRIEEQQEIQNREPMAAVQGSSARLEENSDRNSLEIYFDEKPVQEIIDELKLHRWRWARHNKCWYHKYSDAYKDWAIELINREA